MNAVRRSGERLLPNTAADAVRQLLLMAGTYALYQLVRGIVNRGHGVTLAVANATRVIDFERHLHVFVEPSIEHWALHLHVLMSIAVWFYLNGNIAITGGVLLWIYLRHNDSFYFVRNTFLIAMVLALVGYVVFPTAPPRLMPAWGFTDPVQQVTGINASGGTASVFVNLYAAIPSVHVCFAAIAGGSMLRITRHWALRAAWALYAPFVAFVVVATANHYFTDVALGGLTAGLAALGARQLLARARPDAWAFSPARA